MTVRYSTCAAESAVERIVYLFTVCVVSTAYRRSAKSWQMFDEEMDGLDENPSERGGGRSQASPRQSFPKGSVSFPFNSLDLLSIKTITMRTKHITQKLAPLVRSLMPTVRVLCVEVGGASAVELCRYHTSIYVSFACNAARVRRWILW